MRNILFIALTLLVLGGCMSYNKCVPPYTEGLDHVTYQNYTKADGTDKVLPLVCVFNEEYVIIDVDTIPGAWINCNEFKVDHAYVDPGDQIMKIAVYRDSIKFLFYDGDIVKWFN